MSKRLKLNAQNVEFWAFLVYADFEMSEFTTETQFIIRGEHDESWIISEDGDGLGLVQIAYVCGENKPTYTVYNPELLTQLIPAMIAQAMALDPTFKKQLMKHPVMTGLANGTL